jgi:DNA-binding NarL/FixJ family response regulator
MKRTRVLLADDDSNVRARITTMLQVDFEVVGSVPDGHSLIEAAARLRPDVVVTDISMPKLDGIEAAETIRSILPDIKFVFLTMHDGRGYRRRAQRAGAVAYILKYAALEELNHAIRHAMEGESDEDTSSDK